MYLSEFDFDVKYRNVSSTANHDALFCILSLGTFTVPVCTNILAYLLHSNSASNDNAIVEIEELSAVVTGTALSLFPILFIELRLE